ncbi:hypothetical protein [Aeromonas caviae]|uniref:hypothetical protein n=1 Tax=Aeromonas caviae TaxID=648 RepID=UPI002B48B6F6|nr:hypothetical protein [Aeromonas caviae]
MGYKIVVNEYSNLQGLNSTKVLVSEYAAIGTKTTKVIVVEDTNIGSSAYNEAKAAAVTATNAANQATATLANAVVKSNPISDVAQGTAINSLTRKDYVDSLGKGKITTSITLPSGSPATGYIPVIFEGIGYNSDVYISTAGGSGSLPMNNCSFDGIVRASGWGDGGSYATGMFTIYQTNERAIHSVHAPSESTSAAVFYVEARGFPITVRVGVAVTVRASATNLTYGTSVFAVNGQEGVGNTKTMTLANFNSGTGIYKGSSIVQNQDEQDARYLLKGGDTMTGQLVVSQSGNSSIVINSTTSNDSQLQFQNQGKLRWLIQKDAVVESGSNVGSDLNLFGYNDDGTFGGSVLKVRRSTRQVEFNTSPIMNVAQSTAANSLTRRDFVEAQDSLKVSKSGDTMSGALVITKSDNAIILSPVAGTSSYILGQQGGIANWYVGKGSGSTDDIMLNSYTHGTSLTLQSDRISFNKPAYTQGYKVLSELDEKVWKNRGQQSDLGLASAVLPGYFSFNPGASSSPDVAQYGHGFAVNPGSNGAVGVWSSQFAVTHGTPNKLWHRTGINGAAQGNWKKIYTSDDKPTALELGVVATSNVVGTVSQSSGVPTGAIIERGTFTGGEYVKYSDGTMMQWGRLSISNKAVTSAAGVLFQSAAIDTVTYGPAFVGNPSPSALFLYSSGGARPWPVLASSTATYASFVLQCGMSVSAMAGDYVWQVMGRWF